jgi:hypothetical protein
VILAEFCLIVKMELTLVLSTRHWTTASFSFFGAVEGAGFEDGVATEEFGVVPAALEKNPRMLLCCLPVDAPDWLGADLAGVRALGLPTILQTACSFGSIQTN